MTVIAVFAVSRFLIAISLMVLFGSALLMALVRPSSLASSIAERLARRALPLSLLGLAGLLVWLPLETATIGDGWSSAVDSSMLLQVVTLTALGKVWCLRIAIGIFTVLTVYRSAGSRSAGWVRRVAFASGLSLAGLSLSGHSAANDGWLGGLHEAVDAMHVLAAGAWFGSLVPFLYFLKALRDADHRRDAVAALITFSNLGHATVAITLLSGAANTWLILRDWPFHWHTPYQALLCVKITLTIGMVWVALANRYVWVPRLRAQPALATETIRQRTVFGVALGLTVVGLVSIFGMLSPR